MQQVAQPITTLKTHSRKIVKKTYSATIGSKYQMVIPKEVRKEMNIKPGDKLYIDAVDNDTIYLMVPKKNWAESTRGIAKKAWKNIDTAKYLEDLRNEWDRKV